MMSLKAVIIDDESEAVCALQTILLDFFGDRVTLAGTASGVMEGIKLVLRVKPDIVFLDIEMPGNSGLELAEAFPSRDFSLVFVTAYEQHALKAIKLRANDYLLKPVDIDEVGRVLDEAAAGKRSIVSDSVPRINISTREETLFTIPGEIMYIKADGRYSTVFFTSGSKTFLAKSIGTFEEDLREHGFMRIHKSFLVNLSQVKSLVNNDGWFARLNNGFEVEVSQRKIKELKEALFIP